MSFIELTLEDNDQVCKCMCTFHRCFEALSTSGGQTLIKCQRVPMCARNTTSTQSFSHVEVSTWPTRPCSWKPKTSCHVGSHPRRKFLAALTSGSQHRAVSQQKRTENEARCEGQNTSFVECPSHVVLTPIGKKRRWPRRRRMNVHMGNDL